MKHPQILFLPLLMFSDYFLTVLGAVLKERRYSQHFKAEHYELNPVWQKSIAQKRWFNLRHFLLTILLSVVLGCALEFSDIPDILAEGLFGMLFVFFGMAIGRHLSNILIFRLVAKAQGELAGQITMGHLPFSCYIAIPISCGCRANGYHSELLADPFYHRRALRHVDDFQRPQSMDSQTPKENFSSGTEKLGDYIGETFSLLPKKSI